jgi:hypothetical protein
VKSTPASQAPRRDARNRPATEQANPLGSTLRALKGEPYGRALRIGLAIGMSPTRFSPLPRFRDVVLERRWTY